MAANPSNPPNMVPNGAAASATFSASLSLHQLNGLSSPAFLFLYDLGPEHPASISFTIQGTWRELKFWWKHFAHHPGMRSEVADFAPRSFTSPPSLTQPSHLMPRNHPYTIRRTDSLSICEDCTRLLSRRTCDGSTVISYQGCDFHRKHTDVPFAYRRREFRIQRNNFFSQTKQMLWNRQSHVTTYYLSKNPFPEMKSFTVVTANGPTVTTAPQSGTTQSTNAVAEAEDGDDEATPAQSPSIPPPKPVSLEHVPFLHRYRQISERANLPRVEYLHTDSCLYGTNPDCIVQGSGVAGLYYKRCDDRFVNALGRVLGDPGATESPDQTSKEDASNSSSSAPTTAKTQQNLPLQLRPPPLTTSLQPPAAALAELAWRRHHPAAGPNSWSEIRAQRKREEAAKEAARRAEKRASLVPRAGEWVRRRKHAIRAHKQSVLGRVGGWCRERTGFWGA